MVVSYIPSEENIRADRLSRRSIDTEWELNNEAFEQITQIFGKFEIDLFASSQNAKCERFVSWFPELGAWAIDAFTIDWAGYYFYAFPPFALILKALQKIRQDRAMGVLVVPDWPTQPWYPMLSKMRIGDPIHFEPDRNLLFYAHRNQYHPRRKHLRLLAMKLCGKLAREN